MGRKKLTVNGSEWRKVEGRNSRNSKIGPSIHDSPSIHPSVHPSISLDVKSEGISPAAGRHITAGEDTRPCRHHHHASHGRGRSHRRGRHHHTTRLLKAGETKLQQGMTSLARKRRQGSRLQHDLWTRCVLVKISVSISYLIFHCRSHLKTILSSTVFLRLFLRMLLLFKIMCNIQNRPERGARES